MLPTIRGSYHSARRRLVNEVRSRWAVREVIEEFQKYRVSADYLSAYSNPEPLVSICIGTYNRADLVVQRAIHSSLAQTYRHIEVIVVGDACTDNTADLIAKIDDPRLRFINLPRRGDYPEVPSRRWAVAGTTPFNHALSLCSGDFITHLDDDDEHEPERVDILLKKARETLADLVFHPFLHEMTTGDWQLNSAETFACGKVTTSSVFYHRWFRQIGWDPFAYRFGEPGDWNRFQKFAWLGANIVRSDEALLRHYREGNQSRS